MKAARASAVIKFTDIPNVGPRVAGDFKTLGIKTPSELKKKTGIGLYKALCKKTNSRQDPCVLDTFIAVVDFMNGAPAAPWHYYTAERKNKYPNI
jgi:hypothetical protein